MAARSRARAHDPHDPIPVIGRDRQTGTGLLEPGLSSLLRITKAEEPVLNRHVERRLERAGIEYRTAYVP